MLLILALAHTCTGTRASAGCCVVVMHHHPCPCVCVRVCVCGPEPRRSCCSMAAITHFEGCQHRGCASKCSCGDTRSSTPLPPLLPVHHLHHRRADAATTRNNAHHHADGSLADKWHDAKHSPTSHLRSPTEKHQNPQLYDERTCQGGGGMNKEGRGGEDRGIR